jgi:uncharacterized protein with PIN domain
VDTAALVAVACAEPEREAFMQAIKMAGKALVSTVSGFVAYGKGSGPPRV